MVRVISVHHFVSQDIHICEDPVAATTAAPDYLLLALPQHVVEVRDLSKGGDVAFSFPTVDQAHQMLHCCHGNSSLYSSGPDCLVVVNVWLKRQTGKSGSTAYTPPFIFSLFQKQRNSD
jgi:hypothetical protein